MGKKLNHYVLESLPVDNIDICGIYYIKEADNQLSIAIRDEQNTNWQMINRVASDSIEWENIMNKPDNILGYNITNGATINDVSWGDKQC